MLRQQRPALCLGQAATCEFPVNFSIHLFGGIGLRPFRMKQVAGLES